MDSSDDFSWFFIESFEIIFLGVTFFWCVTDELTYGTFSSYKSK